jgi:hypothetical protein
MGSIITAGGSAFSSVSVMTNAPQRLSELCAECVCEILTGINSFHRYHRLQREIIHDAFGVKSSACGSQTSILRFASAIL